RAGQVADGRRRHGAEQKDIHAGRRQPRRQRVLQHVARKPRVLADDDAVAVAPVGAKVAPRRRAEPPRHLGRHRKGIGGPPNAVGAEKLPAHAPSPNVTASQRRSACLVSNVSWTRWICTPWARPASVTAIVPGPRRSARASAAPPP